MRHGRTDNTGARSAAYAYDGRAPGWQSISQLGRDDGGWHPRLNRLVNEGYIFLNRAYAPGGMLFRGMETGLLQALAAESFWHFPSDRPLAKLERDLDVIFCSEHPGDALAVARPWESSSVDACLILFTSDCYRQRLQGRGAGMLALADPGMVFKYPLLAEPLGWDDIAWILVGPHTMQRCLAALGEISGDSKDATIQRGSRGLFNKLRIVTAAERTGWTKAVSDHLQRLKCQPAVTVEVTEYPQRQPRPCR